MQITPQSVLLVIDVQNDFCPGGALPSRLATTVIAPIHQIAPHFEHIVLTQDWHPPNHASFASAHPGKQPYETIEHALWRTDAMARSLRAGKQRRGVSPRPQPARAPNSSCARASAPRSTPTPHSLRTTAPPPTGLAGYLRERGLTRVFLCGLAYDYCVGYSALDARRLGFEAVIFRDACRAIDLNGSVANIESEFAAAGVTLMHSDELAH